MKGSLLLLFALTVSAWPLWGEGRIEAVDAFGQPRVLNPSRGVAVVLYSNPGVQDRTREAGLLLHPFVGRPGFQFMVLVDLRGTLADWAPGYTQRRIQRDLLKKFEALPPIPGRDLDKTGRPDVSAIADFKGEVCRRLGWDQPENHLRVVIFSEGLEVKRWADLTRMEALPKAVESFLNALP